jgi:hypothetical protein
MSRMKSAVAVALFLGIGACTGDAGSPLAPDGGQPLTTISDAAHAGAVPGFYFLPPMVPNPSYLGTFDGGLQPRVEICELSGTVCGTVIAQYTTTSGTGGVTVQVGTSSYQVNWHTNQFNLDPAKHYRISVYSGTILLGFADVDVVSTGKELKNVDTQEYIPLLDDRTLPIKFRIETGIAGQVIVSPDSAEIPAGGTQQFTATVLDLHGNPLACSITWSSDNAVVATVDGSGLATGVAPGTANITATCQAASGSATLVVINPNTPPVANDDAFDAIGNVTVPVPAPGVLANDTDNENNALQAVPGTYPTTGGGSVTINADGSFSYLSAAGFTGADQFTYTVTDGVDSATATVTMTSAYRVWYVDNAAAGPGDGRDASPFNTLTGAEAASTAGETVFVRTGVAPYDGGFMLKTGQSLTGQGVPSSVTASLNGTTVVLLAAGSAPTITKASGATIQLATNNVVQGVDVTSAAGAGIAGSGFGTLTVGSVSVSATGGPALDLSSGDVVGAFDALSSAGSTGAGIRLVGVGGSFSAAGGSITGSAGAGLDVTGGAGTFSYGGDIAVVGPLAVSVTGRTGGALTFGGTIASTGSGISVQNNSGGTIAFTGSSKSLSTGANPGVSLANNTGATISFGGGGLAIATTTGTGLSATGGGTVSVTGTGNTIITGVGAAISVQNTSTGAAGMTFQSVSADGASPAIQLLNVGGAGVQVTGNGSTAGSGGSLRNATGDAVMVSGATAKLTLMSIEDPAGNGIEVSGTSAVTLDRVTVARTGSHGIVAVPNGSAAIMLDVEGSIFSNIPGSSVFFGATLAGSSGSSTLRFVSNTVNATSTGNGGVLTLGRAATSTSITITDNTFSFVGGNGLVNADAQDASTVSGEISRNTITNSSASAIVVSAAEGGTATVVVDDNQITNAGSDGIQIANFGGTGTSTLNAVVTNNVVSGHNVNPAAAFIAGIAVFSFEDATCLALTGNTVSGTPAGYEGVYLENSGGTFRYEEVPNTAATGTVTPAHVQSQNTVSSALVSGPVNLSDGVSCARP